MNASFLRFGFAVCATLATLAVLLAMRPHYGERVVIQLFTLPVAAAAWYGGALPGLVATTLGVAFAWEFLSPDPLRIAVLAVNGSVISALFGLAQRSGAQLAAILENIAAGAVLAEAPSGRIVRCNAQAEELLGHSLRNIGNAAAYASLHASDASGRRLEGHEYPLLRALQGETVRGEEYRYRRPDGRTVWLRASAGPVRDRAGRIVAGVVLYWNIDAEKLAESTLAETSERLDLALDAGRLGAWHLDLATGKMSCTAQCKANFGLASSAPFDYGVLMEAIHEEDRARVRAAVEQAVRDHKTYAAEYRARWPDGTLHWIFARGRASYAEDGTPTTMSGVTANITERRTMEERLREADRRKDEFIAQLSHELRTPLQAIRLAAHALKHEGGNAQSVERAAGVVERQAGQMARLVDDLLEVARIAEGKVNLERSPVDARSVIAAAAESVAPQLAARRQVLAIQAPEAPLPVSADGGRLTQVLVNLLHNASKYSDEGDPIAVGARAVDGHVVIGVQDHGLGIPADMLERVFELFTQVDAHRSHSQGGLGIGLTLVQRLVALHGGTVSVHSDGPGRGSRFEVRLPLLH